MFDSGPLFHFKLNEYNEDQLTEMAGKPGLLVEGRNGSDFFCINQNGNIGIGTDSPGFPLDISISSQNTFTYNRNSDSSKYATFKYNDTQIENNLGSGGTNSMVNVGVFKNSRSCLGWWIWFYSGGIFGSFR